MSEIKIKKYLQINKMMYNGLMGQSWIGLWAFYFCKNNRVSGDSPNIQQTDVKSE